MTNHVHIVFHFDVVLCRNKTMADKWMYIPNDYIQSNPFCNYNWWLKRLNANLTKTNQSQFIKSPRVY